MASVNSSFGNLPKTCVVKVCQVDRHEVTSQQLGLICNSLLCWIYIVLPIGICLVLLHDKYRAHSRKRLKAQVELLEKIWKQMPS